MLLDCTCPFIDINDMRGAWELFVKSNCDSVYSGILAHPNPYFGMVELNSNGFLFTPKKTKKSYTDVKMHQKFMVLMRLSCLILKNS